MHGWSLIFSAFRFNQGMQGQGQNPGEGLGFMERQQRGLPGEPLMPQMPPPGFIDNPAISIPGGPQEEFALPQYPFPADGSSSFVPPSGSFPGELPGGFNQQGGQAFPESYYPLSGNYYPQQGTPVGTLGPQGPASGDTLVPGGFNVQASRGIPGIPGTYAPQDPSEYGTQFFDRALQTR